VGNERFFSRYYFSRSSDFFLEPLKPIKQAYRQTVVFPSLVGGNANNFAIGFHGTAVSKEPTMLRQDVFRERKNVVH
jgi:hypothetical protein